MSADASNRLTRTLYERYYLGAETADQAALTSSHWARFTRETIMEVDEDGGIRKMRGAGFGKLDAVSGPFKGWLGRLTIASYLLILPDRSRRLRMIRTGRRVLRQAGLTFNIEAFRQLASLDLVLDSANREGISDDRVLIIGDGYGLCAAVWKTLRPHSRIALVDLGRTLLFQVVTASRVHPSARHVLVSDSQTADAAADFIYCPAEHLDALNRFTFDIAINMMSMQEMNEATIGRYFTFLRARLRPDRHLFYCCNRELKVLEGGERAEFQAYPWRAADRHLVDEPCPWWQHRFSMSTSPRGPRLLGFRIPFINYFKPVRHRLTVLATPSGSQLS